MRISLFILYFFCAAISYPVTLSDIVNKYALDAPSVKGLYLRFQNENLEYENYKKSFLPTLSFNLNPIAFNHSLRLLQTPKTGDYSYVNDYSNSSSMDISVTQKIGVTGGYLTLGSSLNYLREFSSDRNSFNTSPLYISYSQPLLGQFKLYKYNQAIMHMRHNLSMKEFCNSMSQEQEKVLALYLNAFISKLQYEVALQSMLTGDTLLQFAKRKLENGLITKYEYNQIELQQLQTGQKVANQERSYKEGLMNLCTEVGIEDIDVEQPDGHDLPIFIDYHNVILLVHANNPQFLSAALQRKQTEYNRQQVLNDLRFNGNVSLSYGLNQYGETLGQVYRHPMQRQSVSITFSFPVFQWGINHNKRKIAENEYKASILDIEKSEKDFENSIKSQVESYNAVYKSFILSGKSLELSREQYRQAVMKFGAGKMSVYEVTQVYESLQSVLLSFSSTLQSLYITYYAIRRLTLYDFTENIILEKVYTRR